MNVGDLVELGFHVTQRGLPEEASIGLIIEIKKNTIRSKAVSIAVINFCGIICEYPVSHLRLINESG